MEDNDIAINSERWNPYNQWSELCFIRLNEFALVFANRELKDSAHAFVISYFFSCLRFWARNISNSLFSIWNTGVQMFLLWICRVAEKQWMRTPIFARPWNLRMMKK
jgi:hypothetical protein